MLRLEDVLAMLARIWRPLSPGFTASGIGFFRTNHAWEARLQRLGRERRSISMISF